MSSEPSDPARQPPPPAHQGRLVFDGSSEADSAVADRLHDSLFPCQPTDRRRSLYAPQPGDDASDTASDGDGLLSGDRPEVTPGPDGGDAPSAEPWLEDTEGSEPLLEPESLSAAARRVLERRQLIRERFARRQRSAGAAAALWSAAGARRSALDSPRPGVPSAAAAGPAEASAGGRTAGRHGAGADRPPPAPDRRVQSATPTGRGRHAQVDTAWRRQWRGAAGW